MKTLLRSTTAYARYRGGAERGDLPHTALVLFSDGALLRPLLKELAKAFFCAEDGGRVARLLDGEAYSDCLFFPAAEGKYTVEDAERIVEESALLPVEGKKKLFVLSDFGGASAAVQNKLLKVLEEPPGGTYFLLGATAEHAVLPTVRSRAGIVAEPPFPEDAIAEALARVRPGEKGAAEAAAASGGVFSVAERLLADGGEEFRLAEAFLTEEDCVPLCRTLGERKEKREFLAALRLVLRDAMLYASGMGQYAARRTEATRRIAASYAAGALTAALGFVAETERDVGFNANFGQALLALAVRIRKERDEWQKLS